MDDNYKNAEKEHYDNAVSFGKIDANYNIPLNDKVIRSSHRFFLHRLQSLIKDKPVKILDYGCGPGEKLLGLTNSSVQLFGIDISPKSIEYANKIIKEKNLNAIFEVMDCEKTTFPDDYFDIIADYGTFSSLNIQNALPEVVRILKPDGYLISIETLGHNPFTNLKRALNVLFGQRTKWAAYHIMKVKDWSYAMAFFNSSEIYYFGFTVLFLAPVLKILPSGWHEQLISKFESFDNWLLKMSIFKKFAFKTVVLLNNPHKKV
jgi:ubiquinone/menaquinone biosynthesis C-methylase UbiE